MMNKDTNTLVDGQKYLVAFTAGTAQDVIRGTSKTVRSTATWDEDANRFRFAAGGEMCPQAALCWELFKETSPTAQVEGEKLVEVLRESLSPEGICLIAAYVSPGVDHSGGGAVGAQARAELEWFRDLLVDMLGVKEYNATMEEVGA